MSGKLFNKVLYYERVENEIVVTKEEAIEDSVSKLENSLLNDLNRDAKIIDKLLEEKNNRRRKFISKCSICCRGEYS